MGKTTGPHKGEPFWDGYRLSEGKQPNGIILAVYWDDGRKIKVYFYKGRGGDLKGGDVNVYDWSEEVEGNWWSIYGGLWLIGEEHLFTDVVAKRP